MKLFLTNLQSHWFSTRYGEGLDKGFFMSYICKRENTENTKHNGLQKDCMHRCKTVERKTYGRKGEGRAP